LRRLRGEVGVLRVVALSRRAGQSAAFAAGYDAARGDVVVMMDADGQSDPADAPVLLRALGPELVAVVGYRVCRADSLWRRAQSRIANAARNALTGDVVRDTGCPMKAVRRQALLRLPRFDGMHRFFPTLLRAAGGAVREIPVSHRPRRFGTSKYGMWKRLAAGWRDALAVGWLRRRALRFEAAED
jgi:glycosyltransferase involved in cell wall biosynthesis